MIVDKDFITLSKSKLTDSKTMKGVPLGTKYW